MFKIGDFVAYIDKKNKAIPAIVTGFTQKRIVILTQNNQGVKYVCPRFLILKARKIK